MERFLNAIERIKATVNIILTGLSIECNRSIGENIEGIDNCIIEITRGITEIDNTIMGRITEIDDAIQILNDTEMTEKINELLKENAPDSSYNHHMTRRKCTTNTSD